MALVFDLTFETLKNIFKEAKYAALFKYADKQKVRDRIGYANESFKNISDKLPW